MLWHPADFYVTATFVKSTISNATGLGLRKGDATKIGGTVVVASIAPDSPASGTCLKPGYQIISINNESFADYLQAAAFLVVLQGTVTILARRPPPDPGICYPQLKYDPCLITGTVWKASRDTVCGIVFREAVSGGVFIYEIQEGSLFSRTQLVPGMPVVKVNNHRITSPGEAVRIIKESECLVSILAEHLLTSQTPVIADAVVVLPIAELPAIVKVLPKNRSIYATMG